MASNEDFAFAAAGLSVEALHVHYKWRQDTARASFGIMTTGARKNGTFARMREAYYGTLKGDLADPVVLDGMITGARSTLRSLTREASQLRLGDAPVDLEKETSLELARRLGREYGELATQNNIWDELRNYSGFIPKLIKSHRGAIVGGKTLKKFAGLTADRFERVKLRVAELEPPSDMFEDAAAQEVFERAFEEASEAMLESLQSDLKNLDTKTQLATRGRVRLASAVRRDLWQALEVPNLRQLGMPSFSQVNLPATVSLIIERDEITAQLAAVVAAKAEVLEAWSQYLDDPSSASLRRVFGEPKPGQVDRYLQELHDVASGVEIARLTEIGTTFMPPTAAKGRSLPTQGL